MWPFPAFLLVGLSADLTWFFNGNGGSLIPGFVGPDWELVFTRWACL